MITIELPKSLGLSVDGKTLVEIDEPCATVGDALAALGRRSPGVLDRVVDEQGDVRRHVNVFRNGESIRFLDGLRTAVSDGSMILILTAISGG
ncbi:MAG TPA: MoaD/ThiS family protein [Gemmatimonadaceae bacterium]|nr:MoaD/ThiS family protein [Gemmatimonadaceae bacterium]